ncbi:hypothetical protein BZA77DRAFT_354688 [Pyronema omphalodes]|nr:hypothetical protein BZA77DRAFT_354688 [Pyronema omphalodes]
MATTDEAALAQHVYKPFPEIPSIDSLNERLSSLGINDPLPVFPDANPTLNPIDIYRSFIADQLAPITGLDTKEVYENLNWTKALENGDLILVVPSIVSIRKKGGNYNELAKQWAAAYPENHYTLSPEVDGSTLRFFFKTDVLTKIVLPSILKDKERYGPINDGKGRRVIVEFSSPNIAKPFHAGHLRSTIIGGFVANLHEICGWDTIRMNYLGDWGKQFGILSVGFKRFGNEEELVKDPIHHLFNVYVKINNIISEEKEIEKKKAEEKGEKQTYNGPTDDEARAFFARMEDGDEEALALWKRFRELSIEKYRDTYARLNISYDVYSGESQVSKESMDTASEMMKTKGISEVSEGAVIVDFAKHARPDPKDPSKPDPKDPSKKLGKAIVRKKDGTSLYLTRDIGAAMERYEKYKFDKMIYVVASQQDLHLQQLFKILQLLGFEWADRLQHVNFGMVSGMSTRRGNVVFLDDILQEAKERMDGAMKSNADKYAEVEDKEFVADTVGRSSVIVKDMSAKRIRGYDFNLDAMTSFEGDTGPYLQYAHTRVCSILRKAGVPLEEIEKADISLLTEAHATKLVRCLAQYPDVVEQALKTLEPSNVVTYLFQMTHILSSSYSVLHVLSADQKTRDARLALYESARIVLHNGMELLGLTPVDRM